MNSGLGQIDRLSSEGLPSQGMGKRLLRRLGWGPLHKLLQRMKFEEILILLPCHSLEDFPLYHEKEAADGLLAAWSALWHPALIADAGRTPSWARADSPPEQLAGKLLVIPQVSESLLQAGWAARAVHEGACVVRKTTARAEIIAQALAALDDPVRAAGAVLSADFLALGFCYIQVEMLTRQMRYMSNLDEKHFRDRTVAAAQSSVSGDVEATRARLQECFDVLLEARERFYPAQAYLVDVTLVAQATTGQTLRNELADNTPRNIVVSGQTVAEMAVKEPATLAALIAAADRGIVAIVGGEFEERELPLLPIESVLTEFRRGLSAYQQHLGRRPTVFGRRRFGLSPVLPQMLVRHGFSGAMHFTLDDGQFPREGQSKTRWQGLDSSAIDALTRVPLDADLPESFLSFAQKMGESMDLDHVAMVGFAHWPGLARPWYEDLRRIAAYAPVLGKFITMNEFLAQTATPGHLTRFTADQYRAPYLQQAIIRRQPDPLLRISQSYRLQATKLACEAMATLAALLSGKSPDSNLPSEDVESLGGQKLGSFLSDDGWHEILASAASMFARSMPRSPIAPAPAVLVVNPHSFARRLAVQVPDSMSLPAVDGVVKQVQDVGGRRLAAVDLPALGYAWLKGGPVQTVTPVRKKSAEQPLAEGEHVRNEFFEARVDPGTGGVRALHDYKRRGNLCSQQLGFRLPQPRPKPGDVWKDPDLEAQYAAMVADHVEVTSPGPVLGEITSHGRLVDPDGKVVAGFVQRVQAWRGSPVLTLEIELDVKEEPRADPWNSYFASRIAWNDATADLRRSVSGVSQPTEAKKLEAPLFVELCSEKHKLTILTGGLPYHRRIGMRMLDTLLVVRGDTGRRFRLGIGVNQPYPTHAAWDLLTPNTTHAETAAPPTASASGWLCHVDQKNVLATHWAPLVEEANVVGLRTRLIETEGRSGRARLQSFRSFASARQIDFQGETLAQLPLEEGAALVDVTAHEWVEIEARFA